MERSHISKFKNGWIVGNFDPAIVKTEHVEIGYQNHNAGAYIHPHYQNDKVDI